MVHVQVFEIVRILRIRKMGLINSILAWTSGFQPQRSQVFRIVL